MLSLFRRSDKTQRKQLHRTLPDLDSTLYPMTWHKQCFASANTLLLKLIAGEADCPNQKQMSQILYDNDTYQQWINFTVFGRYIQRSFAVFYHQSEDSFNADMPDLLRHELMRHAQILPNGQTLFFGGQLTTNARQEKLFVTTLNPVTAFMSAQASTNLSNNRSPKRTLNEQPSLDIIVNQVTISSTQVLAFAVRHNVRTSERLRNEVMILGFDSLRLIKEEIMPISSDKVIENEHKSSLISDRKSSQGKLSTAQKDSVIILRYYELR